MPRGGARVGAGRPKGSLGKPAAARGDKLKAGPRAYGEGVSKDEELKNTEKNKRREERRLRGDDALLRRGAKRSRLAIDPRGDRQSHVFDRQTSRSFVDDLAFVAAEDDDAEDAFLETNETHATTPTDFVSEADARMDLKPRRASPSFEDDGNSPRFWRS